MKKIRQSSLDVKLDAELVSLAKDAALSEGANMGEFLTGLVRDAILRPKGKARSVRFCPCCGCDVELFEQTQGLLPVLKLLTARSSSARGNDAKLLAAAATLVDAARQSSAAIQERRRAEEHAAFARDLEAELKRTQRELAAQKQREAERAERVIREIEAEAQALDQGAGGDGRYSFHPSLSAAWKASRLTLQ